MRIGGVGSRRKAGFLSVTAGVRSIACGTLNPLCKAVLR